MANNNNIQFPINYNTSETKDMCKGTGKVKEFGRSLIFNLASIFGLSGAASKKFGQSDLDIQIENINKTIQKNKWEITKELLQEETNIEQEEIVLMNSILVKLQEQSSVYNAIFDPQIDEINLLDYFRLLILFSIVFVLIVYIDWK